MVTSEQIQLDPLVRFQLTVAHKTVLLSGDGNKASSLLIIIKFIVETAHQVSVYVSMGHVVLVIEVVLLLLF